MGPDRALTARRFEPWRSAGPQRLAEADQLERGRPDYTPVKDSFTVSSLVYPARIM